MIYGLIHPGSGIGNQLHRYLMTRVLAEDTKSKWGMVGQEYWKANFIKCDLGADLPHRVQYPEGRIRVDSPIRHFQEKRVSEDGIDISPYDPEINFVTEGVIDGEFQDERYFKHLS